MQNEAKDDPRPAMVGVFGDIAAPKKETLPASVREEPTVTMVFPRDLSVNLDNYAGLIHFKAGIQEVPVSVSAHWYLKQQGVKAYEKPKAEPAKPEEPQGGKRATRKRNEQGDDQ